MPSKNCFQCGEVFFKPSVESKKNWEKRHKFCSRECVNKFQKGKQLTWIDNTGKIPWNKGKRCPKTTGEKNPNWKGGDAGYDALHKWVYRHKGKPQKCESCGSSDKGVYHWANKSGKYRRNLNDWKRLCASCHRLEDNKKSGFVPHNKGKRAAIANGKRQYGKGNSTSFRKGNIPWNKKIGSFGHKYLLRNKSLEDIVGSYDCVFVKIPRTGTASLNSIIKQYRGHATAKHWIEKIGPDTWDSAFTFTVVRNPFTRFVSAYYHQVEGRYTNLPLNEYVKEGIPDKEVFKPQYEYVFDGDELLVDVVYKYEDLKNAWKDIKKRIGASGKLPHLHKTEGKKQKLNDESRRIIANHYAEDFRRFNYVI